MKTSPVHFSGIYKIERYNNLDPVPFKATGIDILDEVGELLKKQDEREDKSNILNMLNNQQGCVVFSDAVETFVIVDDEEGLDFEDFRAKKTQLDTEFIASNPDVKPTRELRHQYAQKLSTLIRNDFAPRAVPTEVSYTVNDKSRKITGLKLNKLS